MFVPWDKKGDNIDLFPEGFLFDRCCEIVRGKDRNITTPLGNTFNKKMWKTLPYVTKTVLNQIIRDLPEATVRGRGGDLPETPTAARVCRNGCAPAEVRQQLKHFGTDFDKQKISNLTSKYRNFPERYYEGKTE